MGCANQEENALQTASNQGGSICWELVCRFIFLSGKAQGSHLHRTLGIGSISLSRPPQVEARVGTACRQREAMRDSPPRKLFQQAASRKAQKPTGYLLPWRTTEVLPSLQFYAWGIFFTLSHTYKHTHKSISSSSPLIVCNVSQGWGTCPNLARPAFSSLDNQDSCSASGHLNGGSVRD